MTNIEKYNNAFVEVFGADIADLNANYSKETVSTWDSVHQLNVIALIEEEFDIMLEPEDIMGFVSYENGKEILAKYDVVF
jgi:acyl carrier protein